MGSYAVDPGELAGVASSLTAAAVAAGAQLRSLAACAAALENRWQGGAAADFRAGWDEWHARALGLIDALHAMAGAVGGSGEEYASTEAAVRAAAAR